MFVAPYPQEFITGNLIPKVMVLGGWDFWAVTRSSRQSLMKGIRAFIEETPENVERR